MAELGNCRTPVSTGVRKLPVGVEGGRTGRAVGGRGCTDTSGYFVLEQGPLSSDIFLLINLSPSIMSPK